MGFNVKLKLVQYRGDCLLALLALLARLLLCFVLKERKKRGDYFQLKSFACPEFLIFILFLIEFKLKTIQLTPTPIIIKTDKTTGQATPRFISGPPCFVFGNQGKENSRIIVHKTINR